MSNSIYITTTGSNAGKSAIVLGLMALLQREAQSVGYFRPIGRANGRGEHSIDPNVELICSLHGIECDARRMTGVTDVHTAEMVSQGRVDDLLEEILEAYKRYEEMREYVLIEGTNFEGATSAFEFDINAKIARNLGAPVLLVVSGLERSTSEIVDNVIFSKEQFDAHGCDLLGVVANRVQRHEVANIDATLRNEFEKRGVPYVGAVPEDPVLAKPHMSEIAAALNAEVLYGHNLLDNLVHDFRIASMQLPTLLERLEANSLVITAGDRTDIVLGLVVSQMSNNIPKMAGILLTSGVRPPKIIDQLVTGLQRAQLPVLAVNTGMYETAIQVSRVTSAISPQSFQKIETAQLLFEKYVNTRAIRARIATSASGKITPKLFLYGLLEKARSDRKHIVLPEGSEERVIRAAGALLARNAVSLTLLGDRNEILTKAENLMVDLDGVAIIDPSNSEHLEKYAQTYSELRQHKGVTIERARETILDPSYFGTMMVHQGDADGLVSGSVNTTAHTIRPAFEFVKTKPGVNLVSSVFFMCLSDRVLVYGDCAVVPNPNTNELAEIAVSSAATAAAFGIEPRVAMLSYATGASGAGKDVDKVKEATRLAKELRPGLAIEGPIQYDAAIDLGVAKTKLPNSAVAGRATVFLFPDLNTGNNTYKAVQRSANAVAVGPVLQGLRKPVNDLSRGCTVPDIINTVVITAIQAQQG